MGFIYNDDGSIYGWYVTKGDTLSGISAASAQANDGIHTTSVNTLATWNNIPNKDLIQVGQIIYFSPNGGPSTSNPGTQNPGTQNPGTQNPGTTTNKTTTSTPTKAVINQFGLMSTDDKTLFATWTWTREKTESYKVSWTYSTGDGVWFSGNSSTITIDKDDPEIAKQSTYSIPDGARQVRFKVKPIAESKDKNNTETKHWEAQWSDVKTYTVGTPLNTPSVPEVKIENLQLTATIDNVEENIKHIEFQVVKDNTSSVFKTSKAAVTSSHASFSCTVNTGCEYKVRCRAIDGSLYSEWSDYSDNQYTIPATPAKITTIRAYKDSKQTAVYLEWSAAGTAKTYDIEYATNKDYFDISDLTTTVTGKDITKAIVSGLESGNEYFFRVRAVNEAGESGWSEIKSVIVGKPPAAPTTWSSTTTAIVGEPLTLYWVHNTEDGSSETFAEIEMYVDGVKVVIPTLKNDANEDELDRTRSYAIDTSRYKEGAKIEWRVKTAGVTEDFGDWSIKRTIDIYAKPSLDLGMVNENGTSIDTITSFPFYVWAIPGPDTQTPIGYHMSVVAKEPYDTVDNVGNEKTINAGDEVYSSYFNDLETFTLKAVTYRGKTFTAGDVDLENNINYTLRCTVSMNSGLTHESTIDFNVTWIDGAVAPNAEIGVDMDTFTAYIRPYCETSGVTYYKVTKNSSFYTESDTVLDFLVGSVVKGARTNKGSLVYKGSTVDGEEVYYCMVNGTTPITDVTMSVYRREFNGKFTEIATNLIGENHTTVTDPHPALDYARYRVVARSNSTGAISFTDLPGYPVHGKAVVIQWDEDWSSFEVDEEDAMEQPPWSGSMLTLPYNIDVSDNHKPDVALIEYIGREHPISYYGTQLGASSSWSVEIDRNDKETLYALRRLAAWMGDVYVREPSGSGYWANITVSFSQTHCEVTIPVTLDIVRVEGGV